ncbi:uncharacterized protein BX663DRAFT_501825 [Cokeromyces recurvatus]|uniref:uncharacterized protein n=1 Tax=Cokeromyces recurvatus TaxID=90255 RepID=UPI0022200FC9|nr:uncharacterized protein BX663DRAFT_501825 [Cokeromyces recurvatus]KAI7905118.1 hypothetical protein BX663DRAFT_501825 [Cokeromyces recurvatus]
MKGMPYTEEEYQQISMKLRRSLGPEWLAQRGGPNGRLTYIEGHTAINLANEIFGFNGWTSEIKETVVDFVDVNDNGKISLGVSVTIRITLRDGTFHDDIGYGASENARSKAAAFDKAKKQAVTDATKRALRNFGNALGNCLYDKIYVSNIGKMANPQIKFSPQNLYRHIQFDTQKQQQEREEQIQKARQLEQQKRHEQQLELQRQRQNQMKQEQQQAQIKQEQILPATTFAEEHVIDNKLSENSTATNNNNALSPGPIMPEDSFSYEGDDEFFVQMLANSEFEEE